MPPFKRDYWHTHSYLTINPSYVNISKFNLWSFVKAFKIAIWRSHMTYLIIELSQHVTNGDR